MNALAPISDKLAKFMRLLSSDSGGEVIAAVQALHHILQSADADIHALASMVEKPTNDGVFTAPHGDLLPGEHPQARSEAPLVH
jgi:hypothetical protein